MAKQKKAKAVRANVVTRFKWKAGGGEFRAWDANAVGAELERIRAERGRLTPSDVVDAARDKVSPLHPLLPWDDTEAARIGREMIASRIVRSVVVTIVRGNTAPIETRAFVSRPASDGARTYAIVERELETEEGRAMLLRQAWLQLRAWRQRFATLNELAQIFDAIDATEVKKAG